ncbi:uncharacterized protein LOC111875517 isoform X2 [Cryptotermes secundus]|nr:uncharacterized protein LOC111875517 isoform X2 [Cryptotermes secundus]
MRDLKSTHDGYNCKMRWETTRKKGIESPVYAKLVDPPSNSYPFENHSGGVEICRMNWKSQTALTSTDMEKVITRRVPPSDSGKNRIADVTGAYSDKNKIAMDTENGRNRIATGTDSAKSRIVKGIDSCENKVADNTANKENETSLTNSEAIKMETENEATCTKRDKDSSSRREKKKDLPEDFSNSEENGEDECQEQKEKVPSVSVSDDEIQMKNFEITASETKNIEGQLKKLAISVPEELCERSPMGNEKCHINSYSSDKVSSKVLCNGGGIVAEAPALPNHVQNTCLSASVQGNIILPSQEFPFGEASSSPPDSFKCGLEPPCFKGGDRDTCLNDCCSKPKGEHTQNMTVPPSDDGKNRIADVTWAVTYSDKNKIAMGTDNGRNRISTGTDSAKSRIVEGIDSGKNEVADDIENKENEMSLTNSKGIKKETGRKATATKREKDSSNRHDKKGLPEDYSNSEENCEDECQEQKGKVPSVSVSDDEIQLKNFEITASETKNIEGQLKKLAISVPEELCERSPMGNEKRHINNYSPYAVSSKVLCNGGGIVAEAPALPNHVQNTCLSASVQGNIIDSSESDILSLLPSPEYPFGETSSSPLDPVLYGEPSPSSQLPCLQQDDLDRWLNNCFTTLNEENIRNTDTDGPLGFPGITDLCSFQPLDSRYINNCSEQNELTQDHNPIILSQSPPTYRCTASIPSMSSPSSGSLHSSECSTLSSPVSSPGDSLTSKSDLDTETELLKTELILQEGSSSQSDASFWSAELINNNNVNNLLAPSQLCNPAFYSLTYPVQPTISSQTSQPPFTMHRAQQSISVQAHSVNSVQCAPQNIHLSPSPNVQTVVIQNNVQPFTYTVPQQPNIQRLPIVPNLVAASGRERISEKLNKAAKDCALLTLAKLTDEELSEGDEHGDTQLMILIYNHPEKLEYIFAMVNRLKNIPGALEARNSQNQSALLLACLGLPHMPFVARFIAEAVFEKAVSKNEVYGNGNTLLHLLCAKGDSHVDILAELLSMRDLNNLPCFDVNQYNYREGTPLHVAVKTHSRKINCSRTIAFLLSQGADVLAQERSGGLTALHMAIKESCDPLLVQILLQAAERRNINLVNKGDYPGDTALHYVALRNDVALIQQVKVVQLLVRYGAVSNRCGSQGRTPLALVSAERKSVIQRIIHRR